jgi:hypothetical protein
MARKLPEPFSIVEGAVQFKGRAIKGVEVEAKTFEVLGPNHAKDANQVFLVMETKLKPIKRAAAATFRVLGESYGTDGERVFFRDKAVRLKKGAGGPGSFRELDLNYGSDGYWMYFGTQQVEPPAASAFDLASARMRPFTVNAVNRADAVLTDGSLVFLSIRGGEWVPLKGARFDELRRVGEGLVGRGRFLFVSDSRNVWFRGESLAGIDASKARLVGSSVIEDDESVFCGRERLAHAPGDLRWVSDDLYRTQDALLRLSPEVMQSGDDPLVARRDATLPADVGGAFAALIDRVLPLAFTTFDRFLPVESNVQRVDFETPPPGGTPQCEVHALEDGKVEIRAEGQAVVGLPSAWLSMLSRLWSLLRGRSDGFLVYVHVGGMLPDADRFGAELARRVAPELVGLAAALDSAGYEDESSVVVHHVLVRARALADRNDLRGEALRSLPHVPWGFFDAPRYECLTHRIDVTTNLAVAKWLVKEDQFDHEDPRVRWDVANVLNGVVLASNKTKAILRVVLEPLLERTRNEPVGIIRELFWTALDSAAIALTVGADIGRAYEYELLEEVAEALVAGGVNVNLNRVRLIEAYFGQGKDEPAAALMDDLRAEDGADPWPTPGPYTNRERFPSLVAAAEAARERSAH